MPSLDRAAAIDAAYATTVAALAGLCWMGPTTPLNLGVLDGVLTMPTLDPLGGGTVPGLASTWVPAFGLSLAIAVRLRLSGAERASAAIPFAFLAVAVAFACAAWTLSPGPVASLLASFSRGTVVLFLGMLSLGAACIPRDDAPEAVEASARDAEILHMPKPLHRPELDQVALAA